MKRFFGILIGILIVAGGTYAALRFTSVGEYIGLKNPVLADPVAAKINSMTVDEKIGQMLFARVPEKSIVDDINKYHLGGYILFGRDVNGESVESLTSKVKIWQSNSKIKLFIAIDEEGGTVTRLTRAGLADFKSPQDLFRAGGLDLIKEDTVTKINLLKKIGITVNFAPVADTCTDKNAFIYSRSFGQDATSTAEYIGMVAETYKDSGVYATLKHFPGYGNNADTHTGIAIDTRSLDDFKAADFLPFEAGIKAGVKFIMFSHNIIKNVDENNPASISPKLHQILKDDLGFDGIMITDDLSMAAIADYYKGEYPAEVQAVLAGNNMMIVTDYKAAFDNIKKAVEDGVITEDLIDKLIYPVLSLKI